MAKKKAVAKAAMFKKAGPAGKKAMALKAAKKKGK